jgi:hypothetical protein
MMNIRIQNTPFDFQLQVIEYEQVNNFSTKFLF